MHITGSVILTNRMAYTDDILETVRHRTWPLPQGLWRYYQEWNEALFLHWKVPCEELIKVIPRNLFIDTIDGACWISLVAFTMEKIRPRAIPSISIISNFYEVNIRTYVVRNNKPGVYFINIEAEKMVSVLGAKLLSKLPYEKARMKRYIRRDGQEYFSKNNYKGFVLDTSFKVGEKLIAKTDLEQSLIERYCLYFDSRNELYRYDIHHEPWSLHKVDMIYLETDYHFGNISLDRQPDLIHYSPGVKVLAWPRQKIGD